MNTIVYCIYKLIPLAMDDLCSNTILFTPFRCYDRNKNILLE